LHTSDYVQVVQPKKKKKPRKSLHNSNLPSCVFFSPSSKLSQTVKGGVTPKIWTVGGVFNMFFVGIYFVNVSFECGYNLGAIYAYK